MYFLLKMWAFALRLWAYVLVGFCPRGFWPRGFCPRGFCPTITRILHRVRKKGTVFFNNCRHSFVIFGMNHPEDSFYAENRKLIPIHYVVMT